MAHHQAAERIRQVRHIEAPFGLRFKSAGEGRGAASGIYLASYFTGGLIGSLILGQVFDRFGWSACVAGIGAALLTAGLLTTRLRPSLIALSGNQELSS